MIYKLQSPTGQIHEIEGPDGASDNDVFAFASSQGLMDTPRSPREPSLFDKAVTLSSIPMRGMRGLAMGAKELLSGPEDTFSMENLENATLKASEAVGIPEGDIFSPGKFEEFKPETAGDKAVGLVADLADPRSMAVGVGLGKAASVVGKTIGKYGTKAVNTVIKPLVEMPETVGVTLKGGGAASWTVPGGMAPKSLGAIEAAIKPGTEMAVRSLGYVGGGMPGFIASEVVTKPAASFAAKTIHKTLEKLLSNASPLAAQKMAKTREVFDPQKYAKLFSTVAKNTGQYGSQAAIALAYSLQQTDPVFNQAYHATYEEELLKERGGR